MTVGGFRCRNCLELMIFLWIFFVLQNNAVCSTWNVTLESYYDHTSRLRENEKWNINIFSLEDAALNKVHP